MLWRIEFRKHVFVFLACWLVVAVTGTAALVAPHVVALQAVQAFGTMLAWCAATVYSAGVLLSYFTLGDDLLLHIGSLPRTRVALMKAAVLAVLMYLLHIVTFAFQAHTIADAAGGQIPAVIGYVFAAKALSIAAFLALVVFLSAAVKIPLHGKGSSIGGYTVLAVGIVIAQAILLWRLGAPDTSHFAIGVGGAFFTANLYANILPLTLTGPADGLLPAVTGLSLLLNGAAIVLFAGLWALLVRTRRLNFYTL